MRVFHNSVSVFIHLYSSGSPYVKGWRFFPVARGPVPRARSCIPGMARDRPSPYVKGRRFFYRSAGACPPRSLGCARHGEGQVFPPSYVKEAAFFYRSAGACPPRAFVYPRHGEGQALALREGEPFFHHSAEACHRDVGRFMKHPH